MLKKAVVLSTLVIGTLFATLASADEIDLNQADLQCVINRSESLYIFQNTKKVVYALFPQIKEELKDASFQINRCPLCYTFSGTANGHKYEGTTEGILEGMKIKEIKLDLKIDGIKQDRAYCLNPY